MEMAMFPSSCLRSAVTGIVLHRGRTFHSTNTNRCNFLPHKLFFRCVRPHGSVQSTQHHEQWDLQWRFSWKPNWNMFQDPAHRQRPSLEAAVDRRVPAAPHRLLLWGKRFRLQLSLVSDRRAPKYGQVPFHKDSSPYQLLQAAHRSWTQGQESRSALKFENLERVSIQCGHHSPGENTYQTVCFC